MFCQTANRLPKSNLFHEVEKAGERVVKGALSRMRNQRTKQMSRRTNQRRALQITLLQHLKTHPIRTYGQKQSLRYRKSPKMIKSSTAVSNLDGFDGLLPEQLQPSLLLLLSTVKIPIYLLHLKLNPPCMMRNLAQTLLLKSQKL